MPVKLINNATTTVPSALSSTGTTITVAAGTGSKFPILGVGDFFYSTISDVAGNLEIVKVTARIDDVMTVIRGQEDTIAIPFPANSRFENRITAQTIRDIVDLVDDYLLL